MAVSTTYNYRERDIFDIKTLLEALRFILVNAILAFICLFLIFEELDWAILASRKDFDDLIIDNTSWNIRTIF